MTGEGGRRGNRGNRGGRTGPAPVSSLLGDLLDQMDIRERVELGVTAGRWHEVAGPHIAKISKAGRIRGKTLFVEVNGAAWMTELSMMRHTLLQRLNEGRSRGRVEEIVFVQSGRTSARGWGGRSTQGGRG